jgi:hypothetical protein
MCIFTFLPVKRFLIRPTVLVAVQHLVTQYLLENVYVIRTMNLTTTMHLYKILTPELIYFHKIQLKFDLRNVSSSVSSTMLQ